MLLRCPIFCWLLSDDPSCDRLCLFVLLDVLLVLLVLAQYAAEMSHLLAAPIR